MGQNLQTQETFDWQMRIFKLSAFADECCDIFGHNWMHRNLQGFTRKVWNFGGVVYPNVRGGEVNLGGE